MDYNYQLDLNRDAAKVLDRIDRQTERRLRERIKDILLEPYSLRFSKAVKTKQGIRSSRLGDWRILGKDSNEVPFGNRPKSIQNYLFVVEVGRAGKRSASRLLGIVITGKT